MLMQAIILAGGFGTRLRNHVPDVPKPMAPIHDRPFLAYLLSYLKQQGFYKIVFALHDRHEIISDYFQDHFMDMSIDYAIESEPLGTGGAIRHAGKMLATDTPVFVLNGDTFVTLDYAKMYAHHCAQTATVSMALRFLPDISRYGTVQLQQDKIIAFKEKGSIGTGWINAGIYLLQPSLFDDYASLEKFSFEYDFLFPFVTKIKPLAFKVDGYFIDIGIPEDYVRACQELPKITII